MRVHRGAALAAGLLCAVAATVAFWSGPLLRASSALHSAPSAAATTATESIRAHGEAH